MGPPKPVEPVSLRFSDSHKVYNCIVCVWYMVLLIPCYSNYRRVPREFSLKFHSHHMINIKNGKIVKIFLLIHKNFIYSL